MGCLSLGWIEQLLIGLVVIGVVVALIRLFVPRFFPAIDATILTALNIVIGGIVMIAIIIVVIDLLSCALGTSARR